MCQAFGNQPASIPEEFVDAETDVTRDSLKKR